MAVANFAASLKLVLVHEGGWSNHPADPGGATMKGVIQTVYNAYRRGRNLPQQSVRFIGDDELLDIYRYQYWNLIRGDALPRGLDYCVFDGAVNSGWSQSGKWLQRALGSYYKGRIDGFIGMLSIDAVDQHPDKAALIRSYCANRLGMLRALRTWPVFGRGWFRRVNECERDALKMLA